MTTHIKNKIEQIIFQGGMVNDNLANFINFLSEIRHPSSIEKEFNEAFPEIESRKGRITSTTKRKVYDAIDEIWNNYPKGERELYETGKTVQIENGVKTTKTLRVIKQ